jgi:hypothetical protein
VEQSQRHFLPRFLRSIASLAVNKCHASSRLTIPKEQSELQEGIRRLTAGLRDGKRIVPAESVKELCAIDGWRTVRGGRRTICVFGERWLTYFTSGKQGKLVEADYLRRGILVPGPDGEPTKQPLLPNTNRRAPRCYELREPKPAATA